ncbi:hypothetical protein AcW1_007644 [Taiwanofungus camphoratus]|nr:hypothetical protein AcV5_007638 [Antrodia cinnamomea]KAI0947410.1 hypothetical protein AcV7_009847 [Antrodia cinnamomea]KAI0953420.1 hypothetical protein AcW1_007644 [Antrodia cinnamomea]
MHGGSQRTEAIHQLCLPKANPQGSCSGLLFLVQTYLHVSDLNRSKCYADIIGEGAIEVLHRSTISPPGCHTDDVYAGDIQKATSWQASFS